MQWIVRGANKQTGKDTEMMIEADTKDSAERRAARRGLLVSSAIAKAPPMPAIATPAPQYAPAQPVQVAVGVGVHVHQKGTSGFGIGALVLGIIAVLVCWVPFVGLLSIPIAAIGALLALIGLIVSLAGKKSGVGLPVAGGAICVLAIVVAIISTGGTATAIGAAAAQAQAQSMKTNQVSAAPVTPSAAEPTASAPKEEWALATSPVQSGDVQIKVVSAKVGKVKTKTFSGEVEGDQTRLAIALELSNKSKTKKLDYSTWAGADFVIGRDFATLVDDSSNSYKRITYSGMESPVGRSAHESIYPGKSVSDVLVFEQPIDDAKYLNLEMPAKNFGGEGMIRLRIPAAMIAK